MSTSFEAYPLNDTIPSYGAILALATNRLGTYFKEMGIQTDVNLCFDVRNSVNQSFRIPLTDGFDYQGEGYAWFYWKGISGGTDAYFLNIEDLDRECWQEIISLEPRLQTFATRVQKSLRIGHYWYFNRSAGQSAHINLAYGFLAAAVAELTEGFLYSSDCAWDCERLPCTPKDFYAYWFRPEHGLKLETRKWHQNCLDSIRLHSP